VFVLVRTGPSLPTIHPEAIRGARPAELTQDPPSVGAKGASEMDLTLSWPAVIVLGVGAYVILDGFDLGVGILFPLMPDEASRDTAIASIAPVWDGNETWLILGGAVLFGAFPLAYSIALTAFYIPIMLLLFALIFRGVAFEFRVKAKATRTLWNRAFSVGSTLAAFAQGLLLGGLLEGVKIEGRRFVGGAFDWLTPFSIVHGLGVVGGYALLGATWLNLKTEGDAASVLAPPAQWAAGLADRAGHRLDLHAAEVSGDCRALVRRHELAQPAPVPIATAVVAISLYRELRNQARTTRRSSTPSRCSRWATSASASACGRTSCLPRLTVFDAPAPATSQRFVLTALAFSLPMVMIYTAYAYWVFRGKIKPGAGYAH
jgi:cytochrome d ubiquinol oxidase subunit II